MQTAAAAGSIAVSQATQRLCEGYFEFARWGRPALKGLDVPVEVYGVAARPALRHASSSHAARADPVRRTRTRLAAMASARAGQGGPRADRRGSWRGGCGQVAPDVRVQGHYSGRMQGAGGVLGLARQGIGLAAGIELLKSYFELADEDDDSRRSEKVEAKTRALDPALVETLPYILSLLGIAGTGASLAFGLSDKTPTYAGGGQGHHHPREPQATAGGDLRGYCTGSTRRPRSFWTCSRTASPVRGFSCWSTTGPSTITRGVTAPVTPSCASIRWEARAPTRCCTRCLVLT